MLPRPSDGQFSGKPWYEDFATCSHTCAPLRSYGIKVFYTQCVGVRYPGHWNPEADNVQPAIIPVLRVDSTSGSPQ
jgi:hypothetical protein